MHDRLPPAGWLHTFEAAARHGGFAAAAAELNLTPAAVSQQIRALEARLGFALFERRARGVALTRMGRAYLPSVRRAFEDLSAATAGLFGASPGATLTLRAPPSFASLRLAPLLAAFRAKHPEIGLRLSTSVWSDDLGEDEVDLDIRYGDGRWPVRERLRLTDPVSVPICPPGTDWGTDPARRLATLARGSAIHISGCENLWGRIAPALGLAPEAIEATLAADTSLVALEMVASGLGTAIVARDLAEGHLEGGRVSTPPGIALVHDQAHWLVTPQGPRPLRPEARLMRDWLAERFS